MQEVRDSLNLGDKRYRIEELEKNMEAPDFWDDSEKASQAMKEVKDLKDIVGRADGLQQKYEDIMTLIEMAYEEEDEELAAEIGEELAAFTSEFDDLRITTMLTGEYDDSNAILTLHAECRRYRELRLGEHALPYVSALGREKRIFCGNA